MDRHDRYLYWPTSIKEMIQWFPFLTVIEHTENTIRTNKGRIPSLLKVFYLFQLRLFDDKYNKEGKCFYAIAIRCINCNK